MTNMSGEIPDLPIRLHDLSFSYAGDDSDPAKMLLDGLSADIEPGI